MNYIDLLSDSDDDIPLIPSSHRSSTNKSGFAIRNGEANAKSNTTFKKAHQCDPVNLLTSSDDDEPILKRPCQFSLAQKSPLKYGESSKRTLQDDINTDDYPSDHTEKYSDDVLSDHTEKYGSSDKDSLPDISLDDIPPPDTDHLNSEYTDGYHGSDPDNIAGRDCVYDNGSDNHPARSIASVGSNSSPAKTGYAFNAAAKNKQLTTSVTAIPTLKNATTYSSSTSCDGDTYTQIKVCQRHAYCQITLSKWYNFCLKLSIGSLYWHVFINHMPSIGGNVVNNEKIVGYENVLEYFC